MKRNKNVDYMRALAIIVIIAYHCYVISGYPWQNHLIPHILMCFGGELGVTLFFVLSGFGIFWSLHYKDQNEIFPKWSSFMKQRCVRVMPQYYANIVVIVIMQSAGLISLTGLKHLIAYATFTQNLFIETHGSISGVLWTMGTIFQFYIIAIFLYRLVKKNDILSGLLSIAISIGSKFLVYHWIIPALELEEYSYFVYGRQIVTSLDNFVLGMVAASIVLKIWDKN